MEEIRVGEYVRLARNQGINKIIEIDVDTNDLVLDKEIADEWGNEAIYISPEDIDEEILKHSFNIIDLIEVGDYVNGYKVLDIQDSIYENSKRILIYRNQKERYERWIYIQEYDGKIHTQDDIESIVTKEQFESVEYKIGG